MTSDNTVVSLLTQMRVMNPLTSILRSGARQLLAQAIEAELKPFWPR